MKVGCIKDIREFFNILGYISNNLIISYFKSKFYFNRKFSVWYIWKNFNHFDVKRRSGVFVIHFEQI